VKEWDLLPNFRLEPLLEDQGQIIIAYSGGLDSAVLLDLVWRSRKQHSRLIALHVNHGLSVHSVSWADFCSNACDVYGIAIEIMSVKVDGQSGEGLEAAARHARYRAFESAMGQGDTICLAHHGDDQAETLLLQLMRGAGVKGLAAMPSSIEFSRGKMVRPLLGFDRRQLESYARQRKLTWIEDESNVDLRFDRNFLRHQVMPLLKGRWKGVVATVSRSAELCGEAESILEDLGREDWRRCRGDGDHAVSIQELNELPVTRQRNLLRYWIGSHKRRLPIRQVLERVLVELIPAASDRAPIVSWDEGEFRRHGNRLYLLGQADTLAPDEYCVNWKEGDCFELPQLLGSLVIEIGPGGINKTQWEEGAIEVRRRSGGEGCKVAGKPHHRSLKRLFQEAAIPTWERWRMPLLFIDGEFGAVPGLWVCQQFAERPDREGVHIRWQRR
jgi:tRNA(Ile)-lysidine synthase